MRFNAIFRSTLLFIWFLLFVLPLAQAQPFYPTYVKEPLVQENSFLNIAPNLSAPPAFEQAKAKLPEVIWEDRPDVMAAYWKAWELAFSNLKSADPKNGFISPYVDPAFNGNIFMWDCSFMMMYGKYARSAFDFQQTLDNFYTKQHPDGFICREIRGEDGTDVFHRFDPSSTGPNIMPWAEWEYFKNFNDTDRLTKVFPVLLAYYNWYAHHRRWPDGTYYSSGWGCGMDNQQRASDEYDAAFSHGFMSWIDISFQELYAARILIEMAEVLGRETEVLHLKAQRKQLAAQINAFQWDEEKQYYFDRYNSGELNSTMSIGAYWGLLAETIPESRAEAMILHLQDSSKFARKHRVPTLSADDPNYEPNAGYWNGAIWAPTTYMVLRGLSATDYDSLAYQIARNHLENVTEVFNETNTFWENYAPDEVKGEFKSDFVGWTGLAPISVLLEYVFGIRPNVPANELLIDVNLLDAYAVNKYPFGTEGLLHISCEKRKDKHQRPQINISSNIPLKVKVKWGEQYVEHFIEAGKHSL